MTKRTPSTSAERALMDLQHMREARFRGREPERQGRFGVLTWEGPLPVNHPLFDSPSEIRTKRAAQKRARRAPLRERDPWW